MITLTNDVKNKVENTVLDVYHKAEKVFGCSFKLCNVEYKNMGSTAGRAFWMENKIVLSPTLLMDNLSDYVSDTIPHEIAHLIQRTLFPFSKPHGREWKHIMIKLGYNPERCHNMDVSKVKRTKNVLYYNYQCGCRTHKVSSRIHNRMMRYGIGRCKACGSDVKFVGQAI